MTEAAFFRTISSMNAPPVNDEAPRSLEKKNSWAIFLLIACGVAGLDLWSKDVVFRLLEAKLVGLPAKIISAHDVQVVPGFFSLEAALNPGAFSGWFSDHTGLLALLSCVALVVITSVLWYSLGRSPAPSTWFVVALGLLAGGTAGNFYDRYFLGAVRDWIKWYVVIDGEERIWPNFNIADSGICIGVVLIVLLEFFRKSPPATEEARDTA